MNPLRRAFVAASTVWSIGLLLAPLAASRPQSQASSVGYAFALAMYAAGSLICHQRPERSFHVLGTQLPVCARCTGIYAGAAAAAIVVWFRRRTGDPAPGLSPAGRVLLVSVLPTAGTLL